MGQSTRAKDRARWQRELKEWFRLNLPEQCESCGTTYQLTTMHATKRRFINTREDYFRAALVCWPEHVAHEEATGENVHQRMADFVDGLIQRRQAMAA